MNGESTILDLSFLGIPETKQISLANNVVNLISNNPITYIVCADNSHFTKYKILI